MSTEGKGEAVRIHSPVGIRQYFDCVRPFASNDIGFVKYPVQVGLKKFVFCANFILEI